MMNGTKTRMEIKGFDLGGHTVGRIWEGVWDGTEHHGMTTRTKEHFLYFNNIIVSVDTLTHSSQASRQASTYLAYPQQRRFGWVCLFVCSIALGRDRSGLGHGYIIGAHTRRMGGNPRWARGLVLATYDYVLWEERFKRRRRSRGF